MEQHPALSGGGALPGQLADLGTRLTEALRALAEDGTPRLVGAAKRLCALAQAEAAGDANLVKMCQLAMLKQLDSYKVDKKLVDDKGNNYNVNDFIIVDDNGLYYIANDFLIEDDNEPRGGQVGLAWSFFFSSSTNNSSASSAARV